MSEQTIAFYCNDCEDFPSNVEMNATKQKIFIECKDCGGVEKFQSS